MNTLHTRIRSIAGAGALLLLLALCCLSVPTFAQGTTEENEGTTLGNFKVRQVFEIGYRWEDMTGNRSTYNTFVNLNPGPRLFEHSLDMNSINHMGGLFDNFSLHSFGYGGDPNNVTRLRMYKNNWYNFNATFRRDRNFWDYRLLANPFNPNSYVATVPAGTPIFNIPFSPHRMEITRRMYDYNLTIAPQNPVRVRLGYSRNISEGPSLTTFHEGTDVFLFQDWKNTLNTYQIGVDFRILPKTNVSFDQFFHEFKGDTTYFLPLTFANSQQGIQLGDSFLPRPIFQLSSGQLVDIGAIFNFNANSPCASTVASPFITSTATDPDTMKANCNGYLAYNSRGNIRSSYPTSQISFQSSFFKNLDLSGRLIYSTSDLDVVGSNAFTGYQGAINLTGSAEFYQGLVTRTNQRQFAVGGPVHNKRQSWTGDFAMTWFITDNLRFIEQFRYDRWRVPGQFDLIELSLFPVSPQTTVSLLNPTANFTPGTAPPASCPTITSAGCPLHVNSSPADVISEQFRRVLKQKIYSNQVELAYDLNRHFGGHVGYRYRNRRIDEGDGETFDNVFFPTLPNRGGCTPATNPNATTLPDNSCRLVGSSSDAEEWTINEHNGIFGLWARPNDQLRFSFDTEIMYADLAFTRISPRQRQRYKVRGSYQPTQWLNIAGNANFWQQRNNVAEILHRQHNRTYAFVVSAMKERWGFDFGYDYNDIESRTNICFTLNGAPLPPGSTPCPNAGGTQTTSVVSLYDNKLHYAYFSFMVKPVRRLTTNFGYNVSSTTGETTALGPLNYPRGPLSFNYHKPFADVQIELSKYLFLKSSWGYYGYNEKEAADLFTSPTDSLGRLVGRDFRGNLFTASARFVF
jgi:hypothetical protein